MTLDLAQLASDFASNGLAVAEGVFDPAWCESLLAASQRLPSVLEKSFRPEINVHRNGGIFERTMGQPDVLAVVDKLLGGPVNGLQSQFFFRLPGSPGMYAHQDNYYAETDPACFASAWIPLVDITVRNGGLFAYPGSHREGLLPVRQLENDGFDTRAGVREEVVVPSRYRATDLEVTRGSVVFIHCHLVHGSHPNMSDSLRHVLLNTYIRPGTPFRVGRTGKRAEFELDRYRDPTLVAQSSGQETKGSIS